MDNESRSAEGRSEARAAVMAVDMGGRSTLSAGPSLLQVSQTKKKVYSAVNDHSLARTTAARRDLLLQLEKNIVEQMISIDTTVKTNHARSSPLDLRCVVACGMLLLSRSAAEPAQPSWVERTE